MTRRPPLVGHDARVSPVHHHFFVDPAALTNQVVCFAPEQERQITRVLRLGDGDVVVALDGLGRAVEVRLTVEGRHVTGQVVGPSTRCSEPALAVTVYQAMIRLERMEWLLQKGTEVGVRGFVPLHTARGQRGAAPSEARAARLRAVLREAAEQSRRLLIPQLGPAISAAAAFQQVGEAMRDQPNVHGLLLWEGQGERRLEAVLRGRVAAGHAVHLLVGPEGGWAPEEVAAARQAGLTLASLGPRLLRAETAALVAAAGALALAGDLL